MNKAGRILQTIGGSACDPRRLSPAPCRPKRGWSYSPPVNREPLLDLSERVKEVAGVDVPIIVDSQSVYAVTPLQPEGVRQSVECDFLLLAAGSTPTGPSVEQISGFASRFQEAHGYYVDAVALATVVLPTG